MKCMKKDGRHYQNHRQIMRESVGRDYINILNVKNNQVNKNKINNDAINKTHVSFTEEEGRGWNAVYRLPLNEKKDQQIIENYQANQMGGDQHEYHCSGDENTMFRVNTSTKLPSTSASPFLLSSSSPCSVPPPLHSSPFSSDNERKSEPLGIRTRGKYQRRVFGFRSLGRFLASRREKEEEGEGDEMEEKEQREEEKGRKRDDEGSGIQDTAALMTPRRAPRSKMSFMSAEEAKLWNRLQERKTISTVYSPCGFGEAGEVIKDCEGRREETLEGEEGKWQKKDRGNDDEEFERVDCRSLPFCWPSRIGPFPRISEKYLCGERLYESTTSALLPKDADVLCEMDWLEVQKKKKSNVSAEDLQEWMKRILFISTLRRHTILANVLLAWRLVVDMSKKYRERLDRRLLLPSDAETKKIEETFQTCRHHLGRKMQMGRKEVEQKILHEDKEEEEIVMNISAEGHHENIHHCAGSCGEFAQAFSGCNTNCDSSNSGGNSSSNSSSSDRSSYSISNNCSRGRCGNNCSNSSDSISSSSCGSNSSGSSSNCSSASSSSSHRSSSSDSSICNCSSDSSSSSSCSCGSDSNNNCTSSSRRCCGGSSCSNSSSSDTCCSSSSSNGRIGSSFSCSSNSSANSSSCNANCDHGCSCGSFRSNNSSCSDSSLSNNHSDTSCSIKSTSPSTCPATPSSNNSISNNSEVAAKSRNTFSNGKESFGSSSYITSVIRRSPGESSTSNTINIFSSVGGNTIGLTSPSVCCKTSDSHISIGNNSSGSPSKSSNSDDSNSKRVSRSNRYVVSSSNEFLFNKRSSQRRRRTIEYFGDISSGSKSDNGTLNRKFRVSRSEADSGNRNNESNFSGNSSFCGSSNSSISSNAGNSSSSISSRIGSISNNIISCTRNSSSVNSSHSGSVGYSVEVECCSERSKSLRRIERVMSKFCLRGSFSRWHLSVCVAKEVMREGARWKARVRTESALRLSVEKKKRECEWKLKVIAAKMEGLTTLLEEAARMQRHVVDGEEAEFAEKGKRIGGHIGIGEEVYKDRDLGKANANEENSGKKIE